MMEMEESHMGSKQWCDVCKRRLRLCLLLILVILKVLDDSSISTANMTADLG